MGGERPRRGDHGAAYIYDGVTDRDGIGRLDRPALEKAKALRSPVANGAAATIADVFGPIAMPLLTVSAAVAFGVRDRRANPVTLIVAAGAGSLAMTLIGKKLIARNRPPRHEAIPPFEKSPSFPSGHTLNTTTILGVLAYLVALRQENGPRSPSSAGPPPQRSRSASRGCCSARTGSPTSPSAG